MSQLLRRSAVVALAVTLVLTVNGARPAEPAANPSVTLAGLVQNAVPDYCLGQCNDILPPGENGNATLADILSAQLGLGKPPHTDDQLSAYANLVDGYTGLSNQTLSTYFNDSSFGVPSDQVASSIYPGGRTDVTIVRDKATGTPHIFGTTRYGTEFGAGYAAAQDRLWLMDVFRHLGRGELSSFAGGAASNRALEQQFYLNGAYTEADRQAQITRALSALGSRGTQILQDVTAYVAGINQYIADATASRTIPGEYVLTGNADLTTNAGIAPFTLTDLIGIGTVISALFGSGGGNQVQSALVKLAAEARYGVAKGDLIWQGFREENDPEANLTLHSGPSFPYAASPAHPVGVAMPDPGSVVPQQVVFNPTGSAVTAARAAATAPSTAPSPATSTATLTASAAAAQRSAATRTANANRSVAADPGAAAVHGIFDHGVLPANLFKMPHRGMSNALVVSGQYTDDGHPIAVFGPQTGYFAPQLLMLEEVQGPGISARGVAFAGLSMYVELGRGADYSWSATSAAQDNVDMFAVTLCNTDGSPATTASVAYLFHGVCTPMDQIVTTDAWSPTTADSTPAGSYQLVAFRTRYGIVQYRATIHGVPVAYTSLRSTYQNELNTLLGFEMLNDPSVVTGPAGFQQAVSNINYTYNWFYVDSQHTAYYNSGLNPTRAPGVDPNLPVWGQAAYEWRNWDPVTNTVANTPFAAHPNSIDQDYYESWNNKIAAGYTMSTYGDGSVYRSNLLDERIKALIASGHKITRASLVQAMEDAAVTDLIGERVLPDALKVIGTAPVTDPSQQAAVTELTTWVRAGAKRRETGTGSHAYADSDAIKIMDAWWPLLVKGEFNPGLGDQLYNALTNVIVVDNEPYLANEGASHSGSSYQYGWYSYVDKDLRELLGQPVAGGLGVTFCGDGNVVTCRAMLLSTLTQAINTPATAVYPGDSVCSAGDQWCADSIVQTRMGGIGDANTNWQNRPTFQQVVQYPAHRGDSITNLALNKPASASSSQQLFLGPDLTPNLAVDGDLSTRWASNWDDNEQITVDLGSVQPVGRVILHWEAAYAKAYAIQVSSDGVTWQTVWSTVAGTGGTDNDEFPVTQARFVRMQGITRGTGWGYSLYEFEIYAQ